MSDKKEAEKGVIGTVTEALPNTLFRVDIGEEKEIL
jgi:translation initiation factor IF-1